MAAHCLDPVRAVVTPLVRPERVHGVVTVRRAVVEQPSAKGLPGGEALVSADRGDRTEADLKTSVRDRTMKRPSLTGDAADHAAAPCPRPCHRGSGPSAHAVLHYEPAREPWLTDVVGDPSQRFSPRSSSDGCRLRSNYWTPGDDDGMPELVGIAGAVGSSRGDLRPPLGKGPGFRLLDSFGDVHLAVDRCRTTTSRTTARQGDRRARRHGSRRPPARSGGVTSTTRRPACRSPSAVASQPASGPGDERQ